MNYADGLTWKWNGYYDPLEYTQMMISRAYKPVAKWAYVTDGYVHSSPIISTDAETIYVGSHDKKLHAVRMSDGMAKWTYTTGSYIYSSPTLSARWRDDPSVATMRSSMPYRHRMECLVGRIRLAGVLRAVPP